LAEAIDVGNFARDTLLRYRGDQDWIEQVVDVVTLAMHNSVRQLAASAVNGNSYGFKDGAEYVMPARTKDELIASQNEVASSRHVAANEEALDPVESPEEVSQQPSQPVTPFEQEAKYQAELIRKENKWLA
jgi:hypothetical protein